MGRKGKKEFKFALLVFLSETRGQSRNSKKIDYSWRMVLWQAGAGNEEGDRNLNGFVVQSSVEKRAAVAEVSCMRVSVDPFNEYETKGEEKRRGGGEELNEELEF
mmetsp:Transcript_47487/g.93635  ORF Transcript_47487/g.93635 Transcript_47487/m.93635 type:complete len:105 (+) Transcript_47487:1250-1564(+)